MRLTTLQAELPVHTLTLTLVLQLMLSSVIGLSQAQRHRFTRRVNRGGSWNNNARDVRLANQRIAMTSVNVHFPWGGVPLFGGCVAPS